MRTLKLLIRNAFRHKLRTGLTILGITIAILAFGMLRTMVNAWYAGVEASSANRLVIRNSISLVFPLPLAYKDKIRQVSGVNLVSWGSWFGGVYIEEKNFFPNFAVEPKSYLALYPEYVIPDLQKTTFSQRSQGRRRREDDRGEVRLEGRGLGCPQGDHLSRQLGIHHPRHLQGQGPQRRRDAALFPLGVSQRDHEKDGSTEGRPGWVLHDRHHEPEPRGRGEHDDRRAPSRIRWPRPSRRRKRPSR